MTSLEFRDVTVRFGTASRSMTAVDNVHLRIDSGTVMGLVGESGSGKSTLGRTAVGLVPCASGGVFVDDQLLTFGGRRLRPRAASVQLVFQDPYASLDPRMTVGASIAEAIPRRLELDRLERRTEVERLLELVHLDPDQVSAYPRHMSGGQRQRVAIARALAARPQVLIADEITSALDASVQGSILNLVRELQQRLNLTMLYISHNLGVLRYVCDAIAVMYLGRIVEVATADELLTNPQHPYTRALLESMPRLGEPGTRFFTDVDRADVMAALALEPPDPRTPPQGCRFHTRCPVGPHVTPDRSACVAQDPSDDVDRRLHRAACHFAPQIVDQEPGEAVTVRTSTGP